MSDITQRGWWQASDGRWYPPSAHPDARAQADTQAQTSAPLVAHHSFPYESVHLGDPAAPFAGPQALPTTTAPAFTPARIFQPAQTFQPPQHFQPVQQPQGEPHPFAGMGSPAEPPPLHPVPTYHSEPLPPFWADQQPFSAVPAPSRPAWHEPSARQSPWPWVGIVAAVLILIPVIWFGSTQLRDEPAKPAATTTRTGVQSGHIKTGANPVTATGLLTADQGKVVYSDDFHDPKSGWDKQEQLWGNKVTYGPGGLTITPKDFGTTDLAPPYKGQVDQVALSVSTSVDGATSSGDGVEITCYQKTADGEASYKFSLESPNQWGLMQAELVGTLTTGHGSGGTSPIPLGAAPVTVVAVCATLADGQSVRVALFINGTSVLDRVDQRSGLSNTGWAAKVRVYSSKNVPPVSLHKFEVRNLAP